MQNDIEVWDVDKKELAHIYSCKAVTAFSVLQGTPFMYIGDAKGNVFVLQFDRESNQIVRMQYFIPASVTHGVVVERGKDPSVVCILPQPFYEFSRVLIVFRSGLLILWGIQESKVLAVRGNTHIQPKKKFMAANEGESQSLDGFNNTDHEEEKQISSACWVCLNGSRIAVGYTNGDIWLWSVPTVSKFKTDSEAKGLKSCDTQSLPISKLQLSNRKAKAPIVSLRWHPGSDKWGRLYVNGGGDFGSSNVIRVFRLQETGLVRHHTNLSELELVLPNSFMEMSLLSNTHTKNKDEGESLLVLTKPGQLYVYNDVDIEKHLRNTEHKSPPSLPKPIMIKPPFTDSSVTVAKLVTIPDNIDSSKILSQLHRVSKQLFPSIIPVGTKWSAKEKSSFSTDSDRSVKIRSLYITGHSNGTINLWDASSPHIFLVLTIKAQSDVEATLRASPVTAMDFCALSRVLVVGDQLGMVRIYKLVPGDREVKHQTNMGSALHGKIQESAAYIQNIGALKVHKTAIRCISLDSDSTRVAAGCEEGLVSLIDLKSCTTLSVRRYFNGFSSSINSLQFERSFPGSKRAVLFVAARDASVVALNGDSGDSLSPFILRPKKPSTAIFMHVLGVKCTEQSTNPGMGSDDKEVHLPKQPNHHEENNIPHADSSQSFLLLCSENCLWLYSASAIVQGMKKVYLKDKFQATCCWASTFQSSNYDLGLILLYTTGKIEIRSLPDLSVLKETTLSRWSLYDLKPSTDLISSLSCASNGRLVMIDGDKELFLFSLLIEDNNFRLSGSMVCIYNKDIQISLKLPAVSLPLPAKKKSIVGVLIKEIKGSKSKRSSNIEDQEIRSTIGALELSSIFSTHNFPASAASLDEQLISDADDDKLDIDDLELEDHDESSNQHISGASSNRSMVSKLRRKLKGKKRSKEVQATDKQFKEKDKEDVNRVRTPAEIKSAYGHTKLRETNVYEIAKDKLLENQTKLQAISQHTTKMEESAENFSSMAEELLRIVKEKKG
eukprot:Gb_40665 [translate_table: standard]